MAHSLMLPDGLAPSNLHLRSSVKTRWIEGDVLDICGRLAEISPRLFLVELTDPELQPGRAAWCVMEMCPDGVARQVKKYQELDARMLVDCQRMLAIPAEHRVAVAQAEIDKAEADNVENAVDTMWEGMGQAMWRQLEHDGFIDQRPVSYPKLGVAAPGRSR